MKLYEIQKGSTTLEGLRQSERPDPQPGPREVLIRVRATSLNSRDQAVATGKYMGGPVPRNLIPLSDGAGEVVSVGTGATRFKPGDRIAATFFPDWIDGQARERLAGRGAAPLDGMLAEFVALHEDAVVAIPPSLSFEEAATLPCAGVTAWHALMFAGDAVKPGDTVLCLGTGGVSIIALQLGRAAGARVIITSSSDEKIARAKALGASDGVNYKTTPEWDQEVQKLTGGKGVDHVMEVGGIGTLARSFRAVAFGGNIALIGVLAGSTGDTSPYRLMFKGAHMHGVNVGSRAMFETMNRAIELNEIKPVVDKVFPFENAAEAYRVQASGDFFGKVVIRV
jgi:NADPH:quinone reductase-like Zn-dependent oxidoreductase